MENKTAFTLVLSLAVIGMTAASASAKLKADDDLTKATLGMLRTTISMYSVDHDGRFPANLEALIGPKDLKHIPYIRLKAHPRTNAWTPYGAEACTGSTVFGAEIDAAKIKDTGGWGYVTDPKAKCFGKAFVDCTHKGPKGKRWLEY